MASRKLTALPTATEVTTSDKIYIVDVSDTTESPQGTSKQATLDKIIQDGEWTPTTSASNSATESVSIAFYQYLGGALCSFSMELEVQLGIGQTSTTITIEDLPISTTFTTSRQSIISATGDFTTINSIGIQTNGNALELGVSGAVAGSTLNFSIVGSYLVL